MRRNINSGIVGPALLGLGLAMVLLGFFGGAMGLRGLAVVQNYWGPENATIIMNNMGSVSDVYPTWTIYHFWYGYSDTEPNTVYHSVAGSEIKIYIDGTLHTTVVTTKQGVVWSLPRLSPGTHMVELRYDGSGPYPPVTKTFTVTIPSSPAPPVVDPEPQPLPSELSQRAGEFFRIGGLACALLGLGIVLFRRL